MCAISAVIMETERQFPPIQTWPLQPLQDLSEVLRRLDSIDKKMGAKDCHEAIKDAFMKKLDERIKRLEGMG